MVLSPARALVSFAPAILRSASTNSRRLPPAFVFNPAAVSKYSVPSLPKTSTPPVLVFSTLRYPSGSNAVVGNPAPTPEPSRYPAGRTACLTTCASTLGSCPPSRRVWLPPAPASLLLLREACGCRTAHYPRFRSRGARPRQPGPPPPGRRAWRRR